MKSFCSVIWNKFTSFQHRSATLNKLQYITNIIKLETFTENFDANIFLLKNGPIIFTKRIISLLFALKINNMIETLFLLIILIFARAGMIMISIKNNNTFHMTFFEKRARFCWASVIRKCILFHTKQKNQLILSWI